MADEHAIAKPTLSSKVCGHYACCCCCCALIVIREDLVGMSYSPHLSHSLFLHLFLLSPSRARACASRPGVCGIFSRIETVGGRRVRPSRAQHTHTHTLTLRRHRHLFTVTISIHCVSCSFLSYLFCFHELTSSSPFSLLALTRHSSAASGDKDKDKPELKEKEKERSLSGTFSFLSQFCPPFPQLSCWCSGFLLHIHMWLPFSPSCVCACVCVCVCVCVFRVTSLFPSLFHIYFFIFCSLLFLIGAGSTGIGSMTAVGAAAPAVPAAPIAPIVEYVGLDLTPAREEGWVECVYGQWCGIACSFVCVLTNLRPFWSCRFRRLSVSSTINCLSLLLTLTLTR
jgi:hypothetical protein